MPAGTSVERIDRRLQGAKGPVDVWVTIDAPSMAAQQAKLASAAGVEKASAKVGHLDQEAVLVDLAAFGFLPLDVVANCGEREHAVVPLRHLLAAFEVQNAEAREVLEVGRHDRRICERGMGTSSR